MNSYTIIHRHAGFTVEVEFRCGGITYRPSFETEFDVEKWLADQKAYGKQGGAEQLPFTLR